MRCGGSRSGNGGVHKFWFHAAVHRVFGSRKDAKDKSCVLNFMIKAQRFTAIRFTRRRNGCATARRVSGSRKDAKEKGCVLNFMIQTQRFTTVRFTRRRDGCATARRVTGSRKDAKEKRCVLNSMIKTQRFTAIRFKRRRDGCATALQGSGSRKGAKEKTYVLNFVAEPHRINPVHLCEIGRNPSRRRASVASSRETNPCAFGSLRLWVKQTDQYSFGNPPPKRDLGIPEDTGIFLSHSIFCIPDLCSFGP